MIPFPHTYSAPEPVQEMPTETDNPEQEAPTPPNPMSVGTGSLILEVVQWLGAIGLCVVFPPFGLLLLAVFLAGLTVKRQ